MKSRVLGLACALGLAAGCQSSAARALSRSQASKDGGDIIQTSHETPAGLPGPSKRRTDSTASSADVALEAGEKALQQFYRDRQDKPAHLQRARVNFETAAKADPTSALAQHRLAIVADLQERFRESESYYRTAMSLDPDNANIPADLGWSYILQERWADADRALQRALQLDPKSQIARDHLAKCREHQTSTQMAAGDRSESGQMIANRPAAVADPRAAVATQGRDPRLGLNAGSWPNQSAIPQDQMGEYLRNQMSQVDNYGAPPVGQPLTIGPRSSAGPGGPPQQQPLASQPYMPPTQSPQSQVAATQQQVPMYGPPAEGAQGQRYFPHYEPSSPATRQSPTVDQRATAPSSNFVQSPQPRPTQAWPNAGAANPIQRTQGVESRDRSDQAMYQSSQLPPLPGQSAQPPSGQPMHAPQAPSSAPPIGYGQSAPMADSRRTLEQARRDAALMGLGVGAGQPFSPLEQPSDRMSPGSMSQLNGAPYASPPVYSPDLAPIPDLRSNPSFFEQPNMTPPTNSMGQTLPGGTSSMMTPGTVNDPNARFRQSFGNPAPGQQPQLPAPPNAWNQSNMQAGLSGYDNARRASDQQVQQTLQSTWAQTPSNFIATPAGGVSMPQPAPPAQMMQESWGRQPIAPEPYPQAAPPPAYGRSFEPQFLPAVNPSAGRAPGGSVNPYPPTGRPSQPMYRDGVVVPEQYGR